MDKSTLEKLLFTYNWWMGVSTVAVAVGILGEYVAHFIFEKEARRNRLAATFSVVFGVLVLGGVVGEYMFGSRLSDVSGEIQRVADKEVAELNKQAQEARKAAEDARRETGSFGRDIANANARAADANKRAAKAEEHLAQTQERAAKAEEHAAEAQKQAAKFNETAERERLARLKLEATLSPRSFSRDQYRDLQAKLRAYSGQRLDIFIYGDTTEIVGTANMIAAAIRDAGWNVKLWATMSSGVAVTGVLVSTRAGSPATVERAANSLILTLNSTGVSSNPTTPFSGTDIPAAINGPNWDLNDIAPIRMMVGAKP